MPRGTKKGMAAGGTSKGRCRVSQEPSAEGI